MNRKLVVVYDWSSNGTNDVIINGQYYSEALFGVDVTAHDYQLDDYGNEYCLLTKKEVLDYIAVSPINGGHEIYKLLNS